MIQNNRLASDECTDTPSPRPGDWLVGGGEMARFIKTPLGPIETWPQSLCTSVSLTQTSGSPIALIWGPGHVQIYNDGYWPICGAKHPSAMGQDFRECWHQLFRSLEKPMRAPAPVKLPHLENMRMFLDRYGFLKKPGSPSRSARLQMKRARSVACFTPSRKCLCKCFLSGGQKHCATSPIA